MINTEYPLFQQLSAVLQEAAKLNIEGIPDSRKNMSINNLDISVRMMNLLNNSGKYSIGDLVNWPETEIVKWRYFRSRPRLCELIGALENAIKFLTGDQELPVSKGE